MSLKPNKILVLYDNRKLAFEQKKDERISDFKRRLGKHLEVQPAEFTLKMNNSIVPDQTLLADINTSGKVLLTMECINVKIQVILSYDSVSSFITSYTNITLECLIDNFVINNYARLSSVIDLQFSASIKDKELDIKKTLSDLHVNKGDVINLKAIPGSVRNRKQYVKPEVLAEAQSSASDEGMQRFPTIKNMHDTDAITAAMTGNTYSSNSLKPTSTLKRMSQSGTLPSNSSASASSSASGQSSQSLSQLLVILKGMREEISQIRVQSGSDSLVDMNITIRSVEEAIEGMRSSIDDASSTWASILALSKEIQRAVSGKPFKNEKGEDVVVSGENSMVLQKLDRLCSLVNCMTNTSSGATKGSMLFESNDDVKLLREQVEEQSKQVNSLLVENKDLRRQVNVVLQNQTKMLRMLKMLTNKTSDYELENDYVFDSTLVIPTNVVPNRALLSKVPTRTLAKQAVLFQAHRAILSEYLPAQSGDWLCCYRGSEHGWQASDFHKMCDDAGPTLVLVKSTAGAVFGAYTSIGFQSTIADCSFVKDNTSFMFVLESPFMDDCPRKLVGKTDIAGVVDNSEYGAIFGSEDQECLVISNGCNAESSHTYYFPCAYNAPDLNNLSINGDPYFVVDDIEVYYHQ